MDEINYEPAKFKEYKIKVIKDTAKSTIFTEDEVKISKKAQKSQAKAEIKKKAIKDKLQN